MTAYIGIDLGTTNSAICSYDGKETKVWKSPEQNDITPSAIYKDKRGNTKYGLRAYNAAPNSPGNAAVLFKRFMGTSTKIKFSASGIEATPEECSAEILKVLYGYLPEEIREDEKLGVVITVPAAFNQMQKNATMKAAEMAGFENVSLMQEPVAAVMRVMQEADENGTFLIYDLGGGTLDIAIAEAVRGKVTLVAHGGIAMCGGRDFDRTIIDSVVKPWLIENFNIDETKLQRQDNKLMRLAAWAVERAKIELSSQEETVISLSESELNEYDLDDEEIYLDIPFTRDEYNELIEKRVQESIDATRETIEKAGLQPQDIARIVFIGGPTNYKPLRDKVCFELGIEGGLEVNPMTAVAEGASIFAESIDWSSADHNRKSSRGKVDIKGLGVEFVYNSRTSDDNAKFIIKLKSVVRNMQFQIDSIDTGWSSGRYPLTNGQTVKLNLSENGDNTFKVYVFDQYGGIVHSETIVIVKAAATIVGIPASHSMAVIALDKEGGSEVLDYLVKAGEALPVEGKKIFKSSKTIKAGSNETIEFNVVEGDIEDPVRDNRPIGVLELSGDDFDDGIITKGTDMEFAYKILDSGCLNVTVSVPSLSLMIQKNNIYSTIGAKPSFDKSLSQVNNDGNKIMGRIDELEAICDDENIYTAREKVEEAMNLNRNSSVAEDVGEAWNKIYEAKKLLAQIRANNLGAIRNHQLEELRDEYNKVKDDIKPVDRSRFESMSRVAERVMNNNDKEFDQVLDDMKSIVYRALMQADGFVIGLFNYLISDEDEYTDRQKFRELASAGAKLRAAGDIKGLKSVISMLYSIRIDKSEVDDIGKINIIRG